MFKTKNTIEQFWKWFSENEKNLRNFEANPDKYLNEILTKGKSIESGLAFELEPTSEGIITMTISADGVQELFSVVEEIISKAPIINGWDFIAFRQRMTQQQLQGMIIKSENSELNPSEMKFFPILDENNLDIIVYLEGVSEENYHQVAYAGLLLLDNILGEYDCVTKVKNYDFQNMPKTPEELEGLHPILDLASYVDNIKT